MKCKLLITTGPRRLLKLPTIIKKTQLTDLVIGKGNMR